MGAVMALWSSSSISRAWTRRNLASSENNLPVADPLCVFSSFLGSFRVCTLFNRGMSRPVGTHSYTEFPQLPDMMADQSLLLRLTQSGRLAVAVGLSGAQHLVRQL